MKWTFTDTIATIVVVTGILLATIGFSRAEENTCQTPLSVVEAVAKAQKFTLRKLSPGEWDRIQDGLNAKPPMEYDQAWLLHDDDAAMVVITLAGCVVGNSKATPMSFMRTLLDREATNG